ncbi:flagellar hook-basal body complex protein FliE [Acidobacteria bacterium AB60]|nr:flagellar hook-basal body complex protein FliE [Acidobacteria bacterium AB60]
MTNISGLGMPYFPPDPTAVKGGADASGSFGDVLKSAIHSVDDLQGSANAQISNLIQGGGTDVHNVMIAVEKADVAFQLMMQVRNKIVSAYQDIEKMQF